MAEFCSVGCRLPHGIVLELIQPGKMRRPMPAGKRVTLKGANSVLTGRDNFNPIVSGFGVTAVDREFAEEWFKRNADMDFVKNGAVFKVPKAADAQAAIRERERDSTGLEPLNPAVDAQGNNTDPRLIAEVSDAAHLAELGLKP